jgi:hypothetical protein
MSRPYVVLLTERWAGLSDEDEAHHALRTLAAALSFAADLKVIVTSGREAASFADGAFDVEVLPGAAPHRHTARLVAGAIRQASGGILDPWAEEKLAELANPPSPQAIDALRARRPDALVAAGGAATTAALAQEELSLERLVWVPLLQDDQDAPHAPWGFAESTDVVISLCEAEAEELAKQGVPPSKLVLAPVPIRVGLPTKAAEALWVEHEEYFVVLASWPAWRRALVATGPIMLLEREVASAFLVIEQNAVATRAPGTKRRMSAHLSRTDLWRMMARAQAVVDLRRPGFFEREVLESLAFGTPVVVPGIGRRQRIAELSEGGVWFQSAAELVECVRALQDPEIRADLGVRGSAWVEAAHGSASSFAHAVQEAVLGQKNPS